MTGLGRSLSLNTGAASGGLFGASTSTNTQAGSLFSTTTTSAQPGGLFGTTTQPQPAASGSLFGASAPAAKPGGLFGASAATSQPATGGGMFGAAASSQPATGGLFGAAAPASQPATGGLFGAAAPAAIQQPAGGLFGAASAQPSTGGLFGAKPAATPATGGLFGATQATTQPAAGGLFGAAPASAQPAAGGLFGASKGAQPAAGGVFGASTGAQPAAGGGLFGGLNASKPAATSTPSLFGGTAATQQSGGPLFSKPAAAPTSLFGNSAMSLGNSAPQQQQVPGVTVSWENIKSTTRFSDLHPSVQETLCQLDDAIQQQISYSTQVDQFLPRHGQSVQSLPNDVNYLEARIEAVQGAIDSDVRGTERSKKDMTLLVADARGVFSAVENLKLPSQFRYRPGENNTAGQGTGAFAAAGVSLDGADGLGSTRDLLAYFRQKVEALAAKLDKFMGQLREVEEHLGTVEVSAVEETQRVLLRGQQLMQRSGAGGGDANGQMSLALGFKKERLRELAQALRGIEDAIVRVAGRVGECREGVVELQFPEGLR